MPYQSVPLYLFITKFCYYYNNSENWTHLLVFMLNHIYILTSFRIDILILMFFNQLNHNSLFVFYLKVSSTKNYIKNFTVKILKYRLQITIEKTS